MQLFYLSSYLLLLLFQSKVLCNHFAEQSKIPSSIGGGPFEVQDDEFSLKNNQIEVVFAKPCTLLKLSLLSTGKSFDLGFSWRITGANLQGPAIWTNSESTCAFAIDSEAVIFQYAAPKLDLLAIKVQLQPSEKYATWTIESLDIDPSFTVYDVAIEFMVQQNLANESWSLMIPTGFGQLYPLDRSFNLSLPYPSTLATMQFFSLFNTELTNLYWATHDPTGALKTYKMQTKSDKDRGKDTVSFSVTLPLPEAGILQKNWTSGFTPVALGILQGNWRAAADMYRSSFIEKGVSWNLSRRNSSLSQVDVWVNTGWQPIDIFIEKQGEPAVVLQEALEMLKLLPGLQIGIHWYVWNNASNFDMEYPQLYPRANFSTAVQTLHKMGDFKIMPYTNGRLFDQTLPEFQTVGRANAVKEVASKTVNPQLVVETEKYQNQVPFSAECPATTFWQRRVLQNVQLVASLDVDFVYIDQIAAAVEVPCFDPTHPHAPGGGTYWKDGYTSILQAARNVTNPNKTSGEPKTRAPNYSMLEEIPNTTAGQFPNVVESSAEIYVGAADGFLSVASLLFLPEDYSTIPAFQVVYGPNALTIGRVFNPLDLLEIESKGSLFDAKLAEMFHYGTRLGWFSLQGDIGIWEYLKNAPKDLEMLTNLAKANPVVAPWVGSGYPGPELPIPEREHWPYVPGYLGNVFRTVMTSTWVAPHPKAPTAAALLFSNTGKVPQNFTLKFDASLLGFGSSGGYQLYQLGPQPGDKKLLTTFTNSQILAGSRQIAGHSLQLLLLQPSL